MQIKRITIVMIVSVLLILTGFCGCIEDFTKDFDLRANNVNLLITEAGQPIKIKIQGSNNTIQIDKRVTIEHIQIYGFNSNNTIYLYGEPRVNGTSTYEPHDCKINDAAGDTQILYHMEG